MFFKILFTFLSSLLLGLLFSLPKLSWLVWIILVPLFFALKNKTKKQAFFLSYFWGLIFWAVVLYWLINASLLGYALLVLYLALYLGFFGLITNYGLLFIPSAWVLLEYLRSHLLTGFPWALLGYSQYKNLLLIQIADIVGPYGISFLIVLVNVVVYYVVSRRAKPLISCLSLLATFFLFILILFYGYHRLNQKASFSGSLPLRISIIQANISPHQKWDEEVKNEIIEKYLRLAQIAVKKNPFFIIWPETSFPGFWEEEEELREKVLGLAKEVKTGILLGTPVWEKNLSYNSAILISNQGREILRYYKLHLVPFGEYIPFPKIFGFLQNRFSIGDYTHGKEYTVFVYYGPSAVYRFSVLICFEDIFPDLARRFVKEGAEFLINITEDGWYGKSSASFQHLQALVFRAIENRRFAVRASNTGYSCVVDYRGKIISELKDCQGNKLFIEGVLTSDIFPSIERTFYSRFGDWFAWGCIIVSLLGIIPFQRWKKVLI